ncbi:hypothetical protein, partial [Escherichia coli]|uniref:hypothetical protein n=1 Tax=Escherichia coli TaxID=562 RepID=UPI003D364949
AVEAARTARKRAVAMKRDVIGFLLPKGQGAIPRTIDVRIGDLFFKIIWVYCQSLALIGVGILYYFIKVVT